MAGDWNLKLSLQHIIHGLLNNKVQFMSKNFQTVSTETFINSGIKSKSELKEKHCRGNLNLCKPIINEMGWTKKQEERLKIHDHIYLIELAPCKNMLESVGTF